MKWNPAPFQAHLEDITKQLKRQAFWKTALFGVVLLERQWPVYERLSIGREWGASKEVRQVLDRFWQGIPTGARIHDKYLLLLEENPVEPLEEPWDSIAACTVADSLRLLHVFWGKDKGAAGGLAEGNFRCLALFLEACGEECAPNHPLLGAEMAFQRTLCGRLCGAANSEKASFVTACKGEAHGSLLGERWFPDYPEYKPLKRRGKKGAELRYSSSKYELVVQEMRGGTQSAWEARQARIAEHGQILRERKYPVTSRPAQPADVVYQYDVLGWEYSAGAKECLLCTGDTDQVRALYWLAARSREVSLSLVERGWPGAEKMISGFGRDLRTPALYAYLGNDVPLACRLLERCWRTDYPGPNLQMLREPRTGWLDREENRFLYELLQGNLDRAQALLEGCGDPWAAPYRLLLAGDGPALRKHTVQAVRKLRGHYEYQAYRPVVAENELFLLKLARQLGTAVEVPDVAELPPALLGETPADTKTHLLAGWELAEEALGPKGDRLLSEWLLRIGKQNQT